MATFLKGDILNKDTRYERTREYIQIDKKAWTSPEPFDHDGNATKYVDSQRLLGASAGPNPPQPRAVDGAPTPTGGGGKSTALVGC